MLPRGISARRILAWTTEESADRCAETWSSGWFCRNSGVPREHLADDRHFYTCMPQNLLVAYAQVLETARNALKPHPEHTLPYFSLLGRS